mmetsp:Transcript_27443/g.53431  ORF Transcript_27443/g.53431 Transcript_27443/m.53431 type:complete len:280 (-) Transcript_27443:522-1361(-)
MVTGTESAIMQHLHSFKTTFAHVSAVLMLTEEFLGSLRHLLRVLYEVPLCPRRHDHRHPVVREEVEVFLENLLLLRPDAHGRRHRGCGAMRGRRVLPSGVRIRSPHEKRTLAPALALGRKLPVDLDGLRGDVGGVFIHVAQHRLLDRAFAALRGVHGRAQRGGQLISRGDASAQSVDEGWNKRIVLLLHLDGRQGSPVGRVDEEHRPDVRGGVLNGIERVERRVAGTDDVDAGLELAAQVREELLQEPAEQPRLVGVEVRERSVVEAIARELGEDGRPP